MPALPAPVPGLTWRPADPDDSERLASLDAACFPVDRGYRMVASEYRDQLTHPACDASTDGIVAVDETGAVVAFGLVFMTGGDRSKHRAFPWGHVHPDHRRRGLGGTLQAWLDARGTERLDAFGDDLPRVLRVSAYDHQADRLRLFERFGYQAARFFIEMYRPLAADFGSVPEIEPLEVYGWSDVTQAAALEVHNRAFADHWGSEPITEPAWEHRFDEFFLPDASFVAYDEDEPVGYITSAMYPHDFESVGRREAWIEGLGTVQTHRRRGIASRLVLESLARFRDRELEVGKIGVDSESQTGAVGIYERLGFRSERTSITYAKWLG